MSAEHVFHAYLATPLSSTTYQPAKRAVLDVWAANGHPLVIEAADPCHGDNARTFFCFYADRTGANFFVTQFPPLASALHCPDHLLPTPPVAEVDPYLAAYAPAPVAV